ATAYASCISPGRVHPDPHHSFPTRRSSDLPTATAVNTLHPARPPCPASIPIRWQQATPSGNMIPARLGLLWPMRSPSITIWISRSEEHTSELQSRVDLVCRLVLENKNETKS